MKKILLILAVYTFPLYVQAQMTLNSSNAPTDAQCQIRDTQNYVKINTMPDVTPKANATWDLTTVVDSNIYSYTYNFAASSSAFPTATFVIPRKYIVSAGLAYNFDAMKDVSTNGIIILGEHIDRQALPLAALTGNNADSLVFTTQDIMYNAPEHHLKYPITMGSKWKDSIVFGTNFNLTITAQGLNNTPGQRKTKRITNAEVKGWGKMRINDNSGMPTPYIDVLAVDIVETVTDSFFLGGIPAPSSLLTAFGLTQGQQLPTYKRIYFRAREYRGLLEIEFQDVAFTKPIKIQTHSQRLKPTSVKDIHQEDISIYPNPVTNSSFTVKVSGSHNGLNYELSNITGQHIALGGVPTNGHIILPKNLADGTYIIKIKNANGSYGIKRINIIN